MARAKHKAPHVAVVASGRSGALSVAMVVAACVALLVGINPYGGLAQPSDLPLLCLGVAGLCAALLLPGVDSFSALVRWPLAWPFAAIAVWSVASSLASGRLGGATFGANGTALGWPVIVLGTVIVLASAFHVGRLRQTLVWAAAAVLVVQFVMTIVELATRTVPTGTLSNTSNTGLVVVLLAPMVFWSAVNAEGLWPRVWRFAVAGTALWTVVIGAARVSSVALVLALLVWGIFAISRRFGQRAGLVSAAALGAALIAGVAFVVVRWSSLSGGALGEFWRSRYSLWEPAMRAIVARPVAGFGPDGYQVSLARFGDRGAFAAWAYWPPSVDPHNMVLWFGVSLGVVGLALLGWAGFEVGRSWLRQARATLPGVPVGPLATGVVLYAVSALATPVAIQTLAIALIVLGASLRPPATTAPELPRGYSLALRWSAVALAVLVCAYGLTRLSVANRLAPVDPYASQRAADLWPVDPYLQYSASLVWGYAAQGSPVVTQHQYDLIAIRKAVALEPSNPYYQLELARTLASYGASQADVEAAYRRAVELAPASPEAAAAYADFLIVTGRKLEAKALLDRAERLAASTEMARVFAVYYRAIGNESEARRYDELQRAIAIKLAPPS